AQILTQGQGGTTISIRTRSQFIGRSEAGSHRIGTGAKTYGTTHRPCLYPGYQDALGEARYYQDQLMAAEIDFISYAKYRAQQASSERMRSCTHSVESTEGQRALNPDQEEATSAQRLVLIE
ncbi:hypothetical protein KI387_025191, partial [Taxus chinensis]